MRAATSPDPRADLGLPAAADGNRADAAQRSANDQVWRAGRFLSEYASRGLRPVEVVLLAEYRDALRGRVLELGCGAGRLTGYLAQLATSTHGIDVAPTMVEYCRRRYPSATFSVGDLRDVGALGEAAYDAVVAGFNVLDVVGHADRVAILGGIHRTLSPGGVLILSSHNRAAADRVGRPSSLRGRTLAGLADALVRLPRRLRNRRRLRPFEQHRPDHAILNDSAHDFAVLHYYIERDEQEGQLERAGYELLACLDLDGNPVHRGERAPWSPELHYVARRRP